jgi:hypothetical protein
MQHQAPTHIVLSLLCWWPSGSWAATFGGGDARVRSAPTPFRHRLGRQCIVPTPNSTQYAELTRLLQAHTYWTPEQLEFLDGVKTKVAGRQTRPPLGAFGNNHYDHAAIGAWDSYRRSSMLEPLAADVLKSGIPGDFLEAGVFRGGTSVFLAAMLRAAGELGNRRRAADRHLQRRMWLADAFGVGMPQDDYADRLLVRKNLSRESVDEQKISWSGKFKDSLLSSAVVAGSVACHLNITCTNPGLTVGALLVPHLHSLHSHTRPRAEDRQTRKYVESAMAKREPVRRSLEEAGIHLIEGYFNETLPGPVHRLAMLRVDADGFAPTYEVLERLYPRLSVGGYVVFDDWKIIQSQQAILHYRQEHNITAPIFASLRSWPKPMQTIDCMAFWRKDRLSGTFATL